MKTVTVAGNAPFDAVRAEAGPAVESNPHVIIDGLRGEMERVRLTNDSSCICIVSPDGAVDGSMMDVLGEWFASSLRPVDDLYRIADSQFLFMLRQVDRDGAVYVIKRTRELLLSEFPSVAVGGADGQVTASFGGTILDSIEPLHEHMDRASEAHSWALKGSGDTICMWTPRV